MAGDDGYGLYDEPEPGGPAAGAPQTGGPLPGYPAPAPAGPPPGYPPAAPAGPLPGYPQSPPYAPPGSGLPPYSQPGMLAASADRDRATDLVKAAFGEGRLGKDEFDARCGRLLNARTYHDIALIVADLPGGSAFAPAPSPAPLLPPPGTALVPTPYAAYQPLPARPRGTGTAAASFIFSLLAVLPTFGLAGIPAVVLGHISLAESSRSDGGNRGLATAGLVIGYLAMAFWGLVITLSATH